MKTPNGAPGIARQDRTTSPTTGEVKGYGGAAAPPYQSWVGRTCWSAVDSANQHSEVRASICPSASASTIEFVS